MLACMNDGCKPGYGAMVVAEAVDPKTKQASEMLFSSRVNTNNPEIKVWAGIQNLN